MKSARNFPLFAGAALVLVTLLSGNAGATPTRVVAHSAAVWHVDSAPTIHGSWFAVHNANGLWVVSGRNPAMLTSSDEVHWTSRTVPDRSWQSLAYGDHKWVAMNSSSGDSNPVELTSSDGSHWHAQTAPNHRWSSIIYAKGEFVTVSFDGYAMHSRDAVHWSTPVAVFSGGWYALAFDNGSSPP